MKIAHVSSTFPPYEGGIGNVCYNVSKRLAEAGHDVTVFVPRSAKALEGDHPFRLTYLRPLLSIGNASLLPNLVPALRGFDVINLFYPFFGGDIFVSLASLLYRTPYVVWYQQDIYGDSLVRKMIFRSYNMLFQRVLMNRASHIFALSHDHISHSQIQYVMKKPGKVVVVPNGVDADAIAALGGKTTLRSTYGIPDNMPIILFLGAIDTAHYFKRVDLLLQAMSRLRIPAHLVVIGDGDLRPRYEQLADELGIRSRVTFTGKVPNNKVGEYLHQGDFLVLPSTDTESFGIVLVEAMACGKPVIASDLAGVRATVEDGVTGYTFRTGDVDDLVSKMTMMLEHPDEMRTMGEAGRRAAKAKYDWSSISWRVEEVYTNILLSKGHELTHP